MFTSMRVEDWRQFGLVDLAFHPRLTVLTGANATGL
jgi:recombinational DNA repair ATPase RecF